jgi:AcrR family transcriptional regulator
MSAADGTRERIEEVALALLLEKGYEGTSLRSIAEAANVTTPALYWHFPSKGHLCASVVAREFERFSTAVTAAVGPGRPDEQLRSYVRTFVTYQLERRQGAMGVGFDDLVASLPAAHRGRIADIQRPLHHRLRDILADGRRLSLFSCVDATVTAFAITTMCNYVFTWYKRDGRLRMQDVADGYAELAIRVAGGRSDGEQRSALPAQVPVRSS